MATNAPVWYSVHAGPGIDSLLESFRSAFTRKKQPVEFWIKNTSTVSYSSPPARPVSAIITGMRYESGAPGLFVLEMNVDGYIKAGGYYNAIVNSGHFHMTPRR